MARILCVSTKAVQSFEQNWRRVPTYVERQMLFLLFLNQTHRKTIKPCWETRYCSEEWRENCIAWELKSHQFCWFINGTFCNGQVQNSWKEKIEICRKCEVFISMAKDSGG